jgi:DUF1680 family protein
MAQLSTYFYSVDDRGIWVHQYGGNKLRCRLAGGDFAAEQITDYPWSGEVKIVIRQSPATPVTLRLRIPAWAGAARLAINGTAQPTTSGTPGYAQLARAWKSGDTVTLSLPMEPQLIAADPRVEETRNQVAVVRGPIVYCAESIDLREGIDVASVFVPAKPSLQPVSGLPGAKDDLARSLVILRGTAFHRPEPIGGSLYRRLSEQRLQPFELTLIPYFSWSNRGKSAMSVWLPVVLAP